MKRLKKKCSFCGSKRHNPRFFLTASDGGYYCDICLKVLASDMSDVSGTLEYDNMYDISETLMKTEHEEEGRELELRGL